MGLKTEIDSAKKSKDQLGEFCDTQFSTVEKSLMGELHKLREEFNRMVGDHKSDLGRLATQVQTLKAEKTMLQNQLGALQRRILTIDDEIGRD